MSLTRASAAVIKTEEIVGTRNRIINGDMRIDQRNAGASVTYDGSSGYLVDRFFSSEIGNGAFTLQQVTDAPAGFVNSIKMTVTTPQTGTLNAGLSHPIEGLNVADLGWGTANAKTITLSFWVKSSVTGAMGGSIQNSAQDRSYPFNYTVNTTNTWEYKTITIAGDTSGTWLTTNGIGVLLRFMYGTSVTGAANAWAADNYRAPTGSVFPITTSGATWFVTGVQLEVGSTATPFERRQFGTELALCQRYYYRLKQPAGSNSGVAAGVVYTTTNVYGQVNFPVEMRTNPTAVEQNGTAADYDTLTNGNLNICTSVPAFENATVTTSLLIWRYSSSTVTVGSGAICRMRNSTSYLAWSAEL